MTKNIKLEAKTRKEDEKNIDIRTQGTIPAVFYGPNTENKNIKIALNDFIKVFKIAGESALIDLSIDGKNDMKVMIKEVQKDPVKDTPIHADIYQVDMTKPIEVEINLNFINESKAVKEKGGMLAKNKDTVLVKCLPNDLIESVDVDLSKLEGFADKISIGDLALPDTFELLDDASTMIVNVQEPKTAEEIAAEEKADADAIAESKAESKEGTEEGEKKESEDEDKKEGEEVSKEDENK